jgi:tetratricopeptide (TPR) repeat protein
MWKYFYLLCLIFLSTAAAIGQPSKQAITFYNNGLLFNQKNMPAEAIGSFKKAIALYKKYDSAYLQMSRLYVSLEKPDSAILILTNAVKANPVFSEAYITLGNIYRGYKNNVPEAMSSYTNAYKIDSTNKIMLYGLAWCNNVKGYYREAIKYGIKALETDNDYKPAYNELGHAYNQLKAYNECVEQFKKNLAISVNDLPLLYSAYCYIELKQKENALQMYEILNNRNTKMGAALKKKLDAMQ